MVLKRITFALLASTFILVGCVSEKNTKEQDTSTSTPEDALPVQSILPENTNAITKTLSLVANDPLQSNSYDFIRKLRDTSGTLRVKQAFLAMGEKISEEIIKASEEKKKIQKYKSIAAQAGITTDEQGRFTLKTTTYGLDCIGCNTVDGQGKTALGVSLDINKGVQLPDQSWQSGIRFGNYYIIAADENIPLCSILKISEHGLSGSGITPDEPFYAIVLDRGGAITGNHIDLYIGTEQSKAIQKVENATPIAEFVRIGGQQGTTCSLDF